MKNIIKLNSEIEIDLPKLIVGKLLVQANSGGGKSWLIRRIVEQAYGKVQIIILDPEGEFSTLREKFNFVLAGKGGDTPAEPKSAALLAQRLLELKVSAIIDLYELPPQERKRFVRLFLESMVNAPKKLYHPCLVILDEAHKFAPEKDEAESLSAVIDMASMGRKREFSLILATQRISKLHKDAAAECNNKLIGRASLDIDRKRAADELGITDKEKILALRSLEPGEFFAFGPAISNEVIKIKVGSVQTSIPKGGSEYKVMPPTEGIRKILGKLADLPQEAEKELKTISEFKSEITSLRRELAVAKRDTPRGPATEIKRIEVPIVGKRALEGVIKLESGLRKLIKPIKEYSAVIEANIEKFAGEIKKAEMINKNERTGQDPRIYIKPEAKKIIEEIKSYSYPRRVEFKNDCSLTNPEQKILNAIAWMESIGINEPEQTAIAFLAGYKYGGGAYNNPRGALRTKGLIEYVNGNKISLTESGRQLSVIPEIPLTTEELHRKVLSILPGPEAKVLKVLLEIYPESILNEELAERAGYAAGGGAYNNPRGRLRSLGLIEYRDAGVVARSILFI
ncbi:MAG: DUF87 domain-containing protein [Patescibacteria group bacterium]